MSVQAISWVLQHSPAKHSARLVLISLANHAHVDGTGAYPAVELIAQEANIDPRHAQKMLRKLEAAGCIRATGTRRSGTTVYAVVMEGGNRPPRQDAAPASDPARGGISSVQGGNLPPEPSEEPSRSGGGGGARTRARAFGLSEVELFDELVSNHRRRNRPPYPPDVAHAVLLQLGIRPGDVQPAQWRHYIEAAAIYGRKKPTDRYPPDEVRAKIVERVRYSVADEAAAS